MHDATLENPETAILTRVIESRAPVLCSAVAEEFLAWGFSETDRQRMAELAAKARAGVLTPAEEDEAEGYERVSSFLGIVKSTARRSLKAATDE